MPNKIEFYLFEDFNKRLTSKWEKFFSVAIIFFSAIYSYFKDQSLIPFLVLAMLMLAISILIFWRMKNPEMIYRFKLENGYLSIYNKTAILWYKKIKDITDVVLQEEKQAFKLRVREKALIMKTDNDSYCIYLRQTKFLDASVEEVINKIKECARKELISE